MSETDVDIGEKIERLEAIAETLEDGEVSLTKAKKLREEAHTHLEDLRDALDVGEGDIIEIEGDDADLG
jgi:exodeoxyribonuclease VII small subunit